MLRIALSNLDQAGYDHIVRVLANGGVVGMPTDTVYGLAVDASNPDAIERLYRLKGRPPHLPLIRLVDSVETARRICHPPPGFDAIADRFWPGPITFVMAASPHAAADPVQERTIALRWPDSELPVRLIRELGGAITSTSANLSGNPAAMTADEVAAALPNIDLIVDGGAAPEAAPSTVVDLTVSPPALIREGRIAWEAVSRFFAEGVERHTA